MTKTFSDSVSDSALSGAHVIGALALTLQADPGTNMQTTGSQTLHVDPGTASYERVTLSSRTTTAVTLDASTPLVNNHANGCVVYAAPAKADMDNFSQLDKAETWTALKTFAAGLLVSTGQQIKAATGSSTAPAVTFGGEVLGLYRSGVNTLRMICGSAVAAMQWSGTKVSSLLLFEATKGFIRTPAKFDCAVAATGIATLATDMTTSTPTFQGSAGEGATLSGLGIPTPFFATISNGGVNTPERVIVEAINTGTDAITMNRAARGTAAVAWLAATPSILVPDSHEFLMSALGPSVMHVFNQDVPVKGFLPPSTLTNGQPAPTLSGQSFQVSDQGGIANSFPITVGKLNTPTLDFGVIDLANGALEAVYSTFTSEYSTIDKRAKIRPAEMSSALFDRWADAGTPASTVETVLYSDTTVNDQLHTNGDKLKLKYGGIFANNANTKRVRVYYAGTLIMDSTVLTSNAAGHWSIDVLIIRVGFDEVRCIATLAVSGITAAVSSLTTYTSITGLTNSSRAIEIKGQNGTATANDIVAKLATIDFVPVAP